MQRPVGEHLGDCPAQSLSRRQMQMRRLLSQIKPVRQSSRVVQGSPVSAPFGLASGWLSGAASGELSSPASLFAISRPQTPPWRQGRQQFSVSQNSLLLQSVLRAQETAQETGRGTQTPRSTSHISFALHLQVLGVVLFPQAR